MPQFELFGDSLVPIDIDSLEVIQQPASLSDHHQQTAARAVVFLVCLEMLGQMVNPLR